MHDILKKMARALGLMAVVSALGFFLSMAMVNDGLWLWLRVVMSIALPLAAIYLLLIEGTNQGRLDRMFQNTMQTQEKVRGVAPSPREQERFFKVSKGFIAGFIAAAPGILLAILLIVLPQGDVYNNCTTVMRLMLSMFLGVFSLMETTLLTMPSALIGLMYLGMAVLLPLAYGIGYAQGEKQFQLMMKQINDSKRKKRRKKKKASA